ncbi:Protein of unknown function [Roseovarius pacificus]|uniref:DUF3168 domain-containing protein n=1 Tax=Roseovarius pacificus TaxID=337701 RepID=A0A1M7BJU1_9RHOB|nr:DUF3168 domain-containing protein [Roseovarius pacificus]GGO55216.1 hypothetical protein GCM10011315_17230 [Roseovarius pacificus]SHL55282.1 Protein of unknown function [Roseovarius pacificus]
MSEDLAVQKAIRARLAASPAVTALVPSGAILDRNQRPAPDPSIILGESQEVDEGTSLQRDRTRIYHTLHIWKREPSLTGVKAICGAVRTALKADRLELDGYHCADWHVSSARYLRDPDGETSHGVMVVNVLVTGGAS